MGIWGASRDHLREGVWRVDSGSILVNSWSILDPYLGNLIEYLRIAFIWPWVGPKPQYMTKYGPGTGLAGVPV